MPITGFSIGKESAIDIIHPTFGVISLGLQTSFNARELTQVLESIPITNGGRPVFRIVYRGWEGTFEVDRGDNVVDSLFLLLESNFYAGQAETYSMITQTITNPDGSISQYRYKNAVIIPEDEGMWRSEEKVTQRFGFRASYRESA